MMSMCWSRIGGRSTYALSEVGFCPADGELYVGYGNVGRCYACNHPIVALPHSEERMAAFLMGGPDAVRDLAELRKPMPGDTRFAHGGEKDGWKTCPCDPCRARYMSELAP